MFDKWRRRWWWRYLLAVFNAVNIALLIIANLSIMHGFQGSAEFLRAIFDNRGERSSASAGPLTAVKIFSFLPPQVREDRWQALAAVLENRRKGGGRGEVGGGAREQDDDWKEGKGRGGKGESRGVGSGIE
eukprot:752382-Hanusia_phi.AAC.1